MEKEKDLTPESMNEESPPANAPVICNNGNQEIAQFLDEELRKDPELEDPQSISTKLIERLSKQLDGISDDLGGCKEQIFRMVRVTEELKTAEQIISDLSALNRDLTEQFHEREVLLPLINCLIRMADNCREQIDKFQKIRARHTDSNNKTVIKALTFLIDTRKANLVELENVLANLGVESYQHHDNTFEPSLQKCIDRIECEEETLDTHIACRLLFGYKRYDKIVRKECVNVYVLKNKTDNTNNGGN